jgi:PDZ-binding kinase
MEVCTASLGDILEQRHEKKLGALEIGKIHRLGWDVTKALNYLHNEALLLHGDMKSFNILVKGDFAVCKLCDFGVSIYIKKDGLIDFDKNPAAQYTGTDLWSAPEVFEEDDTLISTKSEIFSLGLVFYETITLAPPHTLEIAQAKRALNFDDVEEEDEPLGEEEEDEDYDPMVGTRPLFPDDILSKLTEDYDDILHLFHTCTDEDPEKRPTAEKLEKIFEELNIIVID